MIKAILLLIFLVPIILAVLAVWGVLRWIGGPPPVPPVKEDTVPDTVRTIAFIVLVILLFGVSSGLLGAA